MLQGWNSRSVFFTEDSAFARAEVDRMKADYDNYQVIKRNNDVEGLSFLVSRSSRERTSQQQVYGVLESDGFVITEKVHTFFKQCHSRVIGSQIVEDGFNDQKNSVPHKNRN
eukprot:5704988-Pyramimonas_sp.AAC.1